MYFYVINNNLMKEKEKHWEIIYETKKLNEVSWFQKYPTDSIELIKSLNLNLNANIIDVGAGENWHDFVAWSLENNYLGLENLALIPGTVGAAPIQNIGAYGQEVEAFIDSVEVIDTALMKPTSDQESVSVVLSNVDCQFTYRDSIFKSNPSRFVVTQVRFTIPKKWLANIQYAELSKQFFDNPSPSAKDIFLAVCQIRKNKLPDPNLLGNAGSFFHNPVVSSSQFEVLKGRFPDIIANATITPQGKKYYKLAAGWLIDQCGFKGVRLGQIGRLVYRLLYQMLTVES